MSRASRVFLWAIAAFHLSLLTAHLGCKRPAPHASADPGLPAGPVPDQIVENFTIDSFGEGRRDWVLRAPRADFFEKENLVKVEKPFVQFYDQDRLSSTLESGRGEIHTGSSDLWAWEEVVMVSTEGVRLNSDWLRYVGDRDRIVSTAPVTITKGASRIHGLGWEASPDLSEVFIKQQRVEIEDEPRLR